MPVGPIGPLVGLSGTSAPVKNSSGNNYADYIEEKKSNTATWILVSIIVLILGAAILYSSNQAGIGGSPSVKGALALLKRDKKTEALDVLKKVLQKNPYNAAANFAMGMIYLGAGSDPKQITQNLRKMQTDAAWGNSAELDMTDQYFQAAIECASQMDPKATIEDIGYTASKLIGKCHIIMGITALTRRQAASDAGNMQQVQNWSSAARTHLMQVEDSDVSDVEKSMAAIMSAGL